MKQVIWTIDAFEKPKNKPVITPRSKQNSYPLKLTQLSAETIWRRRVHLGRVKPSDLFLSSRVTLILPQTTHLYILPTYSISKLTLTYAPIHSELSGERFRNKVRILGSSNCRLYLQYFIQTAVWPISTQQSTLIPLLLSANPLFVRIFRLQLRDEVILVPTYYFCFISTCSWWVRVSINSLTRSHFILFNLIAKCEDLTKKFVLFWYAYNCSAFRSWLVAFFHLPK